MMAVPGLYPHQQRLYESLMESFRKNPEKVFLFSHRPDNDWVYKMFEERSERFKEYCAALPEGTPVSYRDFIRQYAEPKTIPWPAGTVTGRTSTSEPEMQRLRPSASPKHVQHVQQLRDIMKTYMYFENYGVSGKLDDISGAKVSKVIVDDVDYSEIEARVTSNLTRKMEEILGANSQDGASGVLKAEELRQILSETEVKEGEKPTVNNRKSRRKRAAGSRMNKSSYLLRP